MVSGCDIQDFWFHGRCVFQEPVVETKVNSPTCKASVPPVTIALWLQTVTISAYRWGWILPFFSWVFPLLYHLLLGLMFSPHGRCSPMRASLSCVLGFEDGPQGSCSVQQVWLWTQMVTSLWRIMTIAGSAFSLQRESLRYAYRLGFCVAAVHTPKMASSGFFSTCFIWLSCNYRTKLVLAV